MANQILENIKKLLEENFEDNPAIDIYEDKFLYFGKAMIISLDDNKCVHISFEDELNPYVSGKITQILEVNENSIGANKIHIEENHYYSMYANQIYWDRNDIEKAKLDDDQKKTLTSQPTRTRQ